MTNWELNRTSVFRAGSFDFSWFAEIPAGFWLWPPWCWLCVLRVQGSDHKVSGAFLLSRLLSRSCTATHLPVYSQSIQQLELSASEDSGLLSEAKTVWAARECSLHLLVGSEKLLSLREWGRIYTKKKKKQHVKGIQTSSCSQTCCRLTSSTILQHVKPHCIASVCLLHTKLRPALTRHNTRLLQPRTPLLSIYAVFLQACHDCVIVAIQKKNPLECRTVHNEELRDKQCRWQMINSPRVRWGDDHEHKMTISHSVKSHLEASALPCSKLSQSAMTFSFKVPRKGAVITLLECKCSLGQLEVAPIPMQGHNNPPFL